ncbi:putative DUF3644 domain-containing protein [Brevibacillus sp. IT-7CA2]|uniref:hypothetical protein n=1 Tax=Brevibacillus sp. IT-7CA2 TaxID=3026436 RepID=UPI0039E0F760
MSDNRNFEQDLADLIKSTDPFLEKLQTAYDAARGVSPWGALFKGPILEFKTIFGFLKTKKFEILPVMTTGPLAAAMTWFGWNSELLINKLGNLVGVQNINYALLLIILIAWYLFTTAFHFFVMANPDSSHFHIGVYQILRKAEYRAFDPFLQNNRSRFSFKGFQNLFLSKGGYAELYYARIEWDKTKTEYERLLDEFDIGLRHLVKENEKLLDQKHKVSLYLLGLLSKAKTNVERFTNNRFGRNDLDFFCPYTLYKLVDDDRLELIADRGTGANALEEIRLEEHTEYASVQVLTHSEPVLYQKISRNRTIFSYRMVMPDQTIWVMNLHVNDSDEKALEFLFGNVIIDSQELLELIRAYCWLLKTHVIDGGHDSDSHNGLTNTGTTGRDM